MDIILIIKLTVIVKTYVSSRNKQSFNFNFLSLKETKWRFEALFIIV